MLIDDYASATDIEKRNELEENCLDSLTAIREVLKKNGLSSDQITWLLYRIEHKWRKACAKATAEKSERMIRSWAADYITLNNRTAKLTEEDATPASTQGRITIPERIFTTLGKSTTRFISPSYPS